MMTVFNKIQKSLKKVPTSIYLAIAVLIFSASNSVTSKLINLGNYHLIDGQNPISSCNVLFVGNICALVLMFLIFHQDCKPNILKTLTRQDWISLTITGILSGAIVPWLIFTALEKTNVTNIVLIGRIEPILILVLSVWLLNSQVNFWAIGGAIFSLLGVIVTVLLGSTGEMMTMGGFHIGIGEILVTIATIVNSISTITGKLQLKSIPIGIFMIYRNILGTVIFFILANILYGVEHFSQAFSPFLWQWMLVYAGVIIVFGQLCWLAGLKNATSTQLNLANVLNPIVAIVMAYLILGEIPTTAQYFGGSLLLVGVILSVVGNLHQGKPTPRNAMETPMGFKGV